MEKTLKEFKKYLSNNGFVSFDKVDFGRLDFAIDNFINSNKCRLSKCPENCSIFKNTSGGCDNCGHKK